MMRRHIVDAISAVIEPMKEDATPVVVAEATTGGVEVLRTFFQDREQFQGKIRKHLIQDELKAVSVSMP